MIIHPSLMKVILPSKSFEYTRKLSTRSTALAIPVIVDASLLSRYTQRYSSVSSNKHSHHRYNHPTTHPVSYHFCILPISICASTHIVNTDSLFASRIAQSWFTTPKTWMPPPPFPLHNKPSTPSPQSHPFPQHRKEPFIHTVIFIHTQLSTPHNQYLPSPSPLVFHIPYYHTTSNTTQQPLRKTYF